MSEPLITVSELTRRFGAKTALESVNLSLPRRAVYGLVGTNGVGKTTLIKHLLGLLRAESGSVRVFGVDPVADPVDSEVATDVTRREYKDCANEAAVVLYTIIGGGHTWPGGTPMPEWLVGRTSRSIDATSLMWAFFREHPLRRN